MILMDPEKLITHFGRYDPEQIGWDLFEKTKQILTEEWFNFEHIK